MLDGQAASNMPCRRTAPIAIEFGRYYVDITALSKTRLSDEGLRCEAGAW